MTREGDCTRASIPHEMDVFGKGEPVGGDGSSWHVSCSSCESAARLLTMEHHSDVVDMHHATSTMTSSPSPNHHATSLPNSSVTSATFSRSSPSLRLVHKTTDSMFFAPSCFAAFRRNKFVDDAGRSEILKGVFCAGYKCRAGPVNSSHDWGKKVMAHSSSSIGAPRSSPRG